MKRKKKSKESELTKKKQTMIRLNSKKTKFYKKKTKNF